MFTDIVSSSAIAEEMGDRRWQELLSRHQQIIRRTLREHDGKERDTGARVAAQASAGEVLASQTVRDLVAGSGIDFEDRGLHVLKGLPEPRRLFAMRRA